MNLQPNGETMMADRIQIFNNQAGASLAREMCKYLSISPGAQTIKTFADGEVFVQIGEEVRNNDVFIVAPTNPPAENFNTTLLLIDALRQASAKRITLVMPYAGYNRQDRKDRPRVARSALVHFRALRNGIDRVLLLDLHSEVTAGFFENVIVDHIYGSRVIVPKLKRVLKNVDFVVASPDKGGGPRAQKYAELLGQSDHVVFSKFRPDHNQVGDVKIIGSVSGKTVVLVDDMIDTGGTMVADADAAMKEGAVDVIAVATHALFSGDAVKIISESAISRIIVTNTLEGAREKAKNFTNTQVDILCAADLLAHAVRRIHDGQSVSELIL